MRRARSDDPEPSWSAGSRTAPVDYPDDESLEYQSSVYSLSNLVESWVAKSGVSTVVLPDAVEMTLEETTLEESDDDDESIPPPAPPVQDQEQYCNGEPAQKKKGCRRYLLGGTLLALVVIAAIAVVAVVVPDRVTKSVEADSFTDGSGSYTGTETSSTTTNSGAPPTREQAFRNIVTGVSSEADLETSGSPQAMAFDWIVRNDPAQLDPVTVSAREIQERYILGVFFYATGGAEWVDRFDFLSQRHSCNWRNLDFGMGVLCDESTKTVNGLKFGE